MKTRVVAVCAVFFALTGVPAAHADVSNDDFANAIAITSTPFDGTGSNVGATTQPGEPQPDCAQIAASVWWRIDPSITGAVTVTTEGSSFDTVLAVYRGTSLDSLTQLGCNDDVDAPNDATSKVAVHTDGSAPLYIQVAGYTDQSGDVALHVSSDGSTSAATNDNFADAKSFGPGFSETVDLRDATTEPNEPMYACAYQPSNTIWYRITPAVDTPLLLSTRAASPDGQQPNFFGAVFEGTSIDRLSDTGSCTQYAYNGQALLGARAGHTYYVQVGVSCCLSDGSDMRVTFRADPAPVADLSVSNLKVTPSELQTDAGSAQNPLGRNVSFDVTNSGPDSLETVSTEATACPATTGTCSYFFYDGRGMASGETRHVSVIWHPSVAVGDFTVSADVYDQTDQSFDPSPNNNQAAADAYVILGGTGQGVGVCAVICY